MSPKTHEKLTTRSLYCNEIKMLWFQKGAGISDIITMVISLGMFMKVYFMVNASPSDEGRDMKEDPHFNGTLAFYIAMLVAEALTLVASVFGLVVGIRVMKNHFQLSRPLRRSFSIWLVTFCTSILLTAVVCVLGLVRITDPEDDIRQLFDIFTKNSHDVHFVSSFEMYQRENSCCGIYGNDDWMVSQVKAQGGGVLCMTDGCLNSPGIGKCHLTPPTLPMGCGRKLLDDIHFRQIIYSVVLIVQILTGIATAILAWWSFFYWMEEEVVIIPENQINHVSPASSGT